jgi:hypothetical protein
MNNLDSSTDAVVTEMFAKARQAWELGDKRASSILINQILKRDITHPGAWELLYNQLGSGKSFDDFQREFVQKYYPDRMSLLWPQPSTLSPQEQDVNQPAAPGAEPPAEMPAESKLAESLPAVSEPAENIPAESKLVESTPAGYAGVKYCPKCGKNRIADGDFCTYCGGPLQSVPDVALNPSLPPVDTGAQGSIHASSTVDTVGALVHAPRAGSSGYAPAPAAGRPSPWKQITNYYLDHKGLVYLIGASAIVLLCLVAGILLLKPLLGKSNGSTADLPDGLTTGVWVAFGATDYPIQGGLFALLRDNKGWAAGNPMTYRKISANALEYCYLGLTGDQGENVCGVLTVDNIQNSQSVDINISGKYITDPLKATMRKRFEDTSSGNLKKDIIGTWTYSENFDIMLSPNLSSGVSKIVFDKQQHVNDSQRGSLSYSIVGDKLNMFGKVYIVRNCGKIMFLSEDEYQGSTLILFRK